MATKAGWTDAMIPRISAPAVAKSAVETSGRTARVWPSLPMVKLCQRRKHQAKPAPTIPPARPSIPPSLRTRNMIALPEYPRVRSTAFSFTRLRTMSRMEFATSATTATTAPRPSHLVKPMSSINCPAVSAKNAFSGRVLVGFWSDLKRLSIASATGLRSEDLSTRTLNWVTIPSPDFEACWRKSRWT